MERNVKPKIVAAVLVAGLLILFGERFMLPRMQDGTARIIRPFVIAATAAGGWIRGSTAGSPELADNRMDIKAQQFRLQESEKENERLRGALRLFPSEENVHAAAVIMHTVSEGKEFLIINKGSDDGITEGTMAVDARRFLIGAVKAVNPYTARVAVAANPGEAFEASITPIDAGALVRGIGGRAVLLELIPAEVPVRRGDFFSVRAIRAPILFGEITQVKESQGGAFQEAYGILLARPERIREVFLIVR